MPRALIFDLDNTLVPCNDYYTQTKAQFYTRVAELFPHLTQQDIVQRFNEIELSKMILPDGFSRHRYPQSMVQTYLSFCEQYSEGVRSDVVEEIFQIGDTVFSAPYLLFEGTREVLQMYRDAGFRMALCTKGDEDVQGAKIERNNLSPLFDVIRIVPQKTPAELARTAEMLGVSLAEEACKVGDSLRDDIQGGNSVGLKTVWVTGHVDHTFVYEKGYEGVKPTFVIPTVRELASVIPPRLP